MTDKLDKLEQEFAGAGDRLVQLGQQSPHFKTLLIRYEEVLSGLVKRQAESHEERSHEVFALRQERRVLHAQISAMLAPRSFTR